MNLVSKDISDDFATDKIYLNNASVSIMPKQSIEAMKEFLTTYTNDFARAAMNKYLELGDKFWTMFARGF